VLLFVECFDDNAHVDHKLLQHVSIHDSTNEICR
jgi:hypothetical protein